MTDPLKDPPEAYAADLVLMQCCNTDCPLAETPPKWEAYIYYPDGNPDGSSAWEAVEEDADLCPVCRGGGVAIS